MVISNDKDDVKDFDVNEDLIKKLQQLSIWLVSKQITSDRF